MEEFLKNLKEDLIKIFNRLEAALVAENSKTESDQLSLENEKLPTVNEKILKIALMEVGTKELSGSANNPRVVEYHRFASKSNKVDQPDSVPWCSSFVCFVAEKAGLESTNSMAARSWLGWGLSSKKSPLPGDIVVFWRGSITSWQGHVGVYLRTNADGSIVTLGGNQSDEVNITSFSASKVLDIRRSEKATVYDDEDSKILNTIAHGAINGKFLGKDGKVV